VIFRSPWNGFPDVAVQTTVAKLKSHPDYRAAKSGDQDAALRVIDQVFKPGKLTDSCDLIVPVLQLDAGRRNMLGVAYAWLDPDAARAILRLEFNNHASERIRQLLDANNRGKISDAEHAELQKYLRVGQLIDLMQAKARLSLPESSPT
jgi:hypothetical protein